MVLIDDAWSEPGVPWTSTTRQSPQVTGNAWASTPAKAALIGYEKRLSSGIDGGKTASKPSLNVLGRSSPNAHGEGIVNFQPRVTTYRDSSEEFALCSCCQLPLGDASEQHEGKAIHGECLAQLMVDDLRKHEESRRNSELKEKQAQRLQYGIGWDPKHIPQNTESVFKLALAEIPPGIVCLVLDENEHGRSIRAASTTEPSAAVNLAYLSTALQVRRTEGCEPVFSLDPVDPARKKSMQRKVFMPEWLGNTEVGEVLFQADYYLKELSMGEYEQPIVGMHSCFDYAEMESAHGEWNAREWFLIRKAEVSMSSSSVLIPRIKMGVEAREQRLNGNSLEDVPISRSDHPLVKYAESFTKNFDLIAERKSVIYHLRELAKAVVLARFIDEADIQLSDAWFRLGNDLPTSQALHSQVPQLWNERLYAQIQLKDGAIVYDREKGKSVQSSGRGVYGGVSLGLPALSSVISPQLKDRFKPPRAKPILARGNLNLDSIRGVTSLPRSGLMSKVLQQDVKLTVPGLVTTVALVDEDTKPSASKGVDLRLDAFDLTAVRREDSDDALPVADCSPLENCIALGSEFWGNLDSAATDGKAIFSAGDKSFLLNLFNPSLTDRRIEGDAFVPPQTSKTYLTKLRTLLQDEESVRSQRMELFLSLKFRTADPGPLFPASWKPKSGIVCEAEPAGRAEEGRSRHVLTESSQRDAAEHIIRHAAPVFDMTTEDGQRFRIYQVGSLEVRTTQTCGGQEAIGAVFAFRTASQADSWDPWDECVKEQERPVKVTEYVEWSWESRVTGSYTKNWHFYVLLETQDGNKVLTEQTSNGKTCWVENPEDLEDRVALAKVISSTSCSDGATFRQLREYQVRCGCPSRRALTNSHRYAKGVYDRSCGRELENQK